ncbi:hypothetical protein DM02DRAFT_619409 [Periconia macrospinosa]|uniref:Chromate transporter n=1 Tax=Periconia macrospinosa TaxID=97972 RepID=A0A2V1D6N5_9PLEO|nr:hypothetical protein DM02DRAFT_619409 [Periconia macrospinosa]
MIFCLALLHAGFVPALFVFLVWSLPGAIGMYALSLGVQRMNEVLPAPVYPLLSGLNASTVGIIALAAVQLGEKAIRDKLTRILVILGACAGLCYNALWYFPLLMLQTGATESVPLEEREDSQNSIQRRSITAGPPKSGQRKEAPPQTAMDGAHLQPGRVEDISNHTIRIRIGIATVIFFFGSFIGILVARGVVNAPPLALDLFANMYLAGTIIFGGGPVVIPLLRSYVVDPGWVSSRDFLLGLAIIQAFPGPNFNFAVYLGALALQRSQFPTIFGAFLGFLGIFFPGITLAVAVQSFWRVLRRKKWVVDLLRGVNATAVGLVFTAVYRLWEIGYLTPEASRGQSLAMEPWWVVVAAVTYAESAWFNIPPALAIVFGAVLGLCWYGAVGR